MQWKTSEIVRQDDGAFRLQVDVLRDGTEEIQARTYVFVAPGMSQADVIEACGQAAAEAYRLDSERRDAEAMFLGMTGSIV
jgi:flagellar basal body rod protein FlgF